MAAIYTYHENQVDADSFRRPALFASAMRMLCQLYRLFRSSRIRLILLQQESKHPENPIKYYASFSNAFIVKLEKCLHIA